MRKKGYAALVARAFNRSVHEKNGAVHRENTVSRIEPHPSPSTCGLRSPRLLLSYQPQRSTKAPDDMPGNTPKCQTLKPGPPDRKMLPSTLIGAHKVVCLLHTRTYAPVRLLTRTLTYAGAPIHFPYKCRPIHFCTEPGQRREIRFRTCSRTRGEGWGHDRRLRVYKLAAQVSKDCAEFLCLSEQLRM